MNFKKCTSKVKGYYYYCTICNKQIDYYEHLKYDGKCELCYYWRPESSTSSKGECDKTGKYVSWNDSCPKFAR